VGNARGAHTNVSRVGSGRHGKVCMGRMNGGMEAARSSAGWQEVDHGGNSGTVECPGREVSLKSKVVLFCVVLVQVVVPQEGVGRRGSGSYGGAGRGSKKCSGSSGVAPSARRCVVWRRVLPPEQARRPAEGASGGRAAGVKVCCRRPQRSRFTRTGVMAELNAWRNQVQPQRVGRNRSSR